MKIGILTIGNELISGRTADANASFIAREVNQEGWSVEAILSVGDDFAKIKDRLNYLLSMADAVICTGGLGPTADDLTRDALARVLDRELVQGLAKNLELAPRLLELMDETRVNWFSETLLNLFASRLVLQDSYVSMLSRGIALADAQGVVQEAGKAVGPLVELGIGELSPSMGIHDCQLVGCAFGVACYPVKVNHALLPYSTSKTDWPVTTCLSSWL